MQVIKADIDRPCLNLGGIEAFADFAGRWAQFRKRIMAFKEGIWRHENHSDGNGLCRTC